jgi:hypothetical protein
MTPMPAIKTRCSHVPWPRWWRGDGVADIDATEVSGVKA